jgi:hypothetical protein
MQPLRRLAHRCVVLLDEIPADLILGQVVGRAIRAGRGICCLGRSGVLFVINITVGRHGC